jgi:tRNA-Thr(GGU) m(6)t(6)A37 methyltransferase TsaA
MIGMEPIGYVKSEYRKRGDVVKACEEGLSFRGRSSIKMMQNLAMGLEGLGEFSHAWVLFHLDRERRVEIKTYPGPAGMKGLPDVGLYASRSPHRPNGIGLRLVRIVSVKGNEVVVEGLDAIDRSPVLDIKPFVPRFDLPKRGDIKTAGWYRW